MNKIRILLCLFTAFFIFAILLNSVGAVILQSMKSFGVSKVSASTLEGFKDLPIAIMSFLVASSLPKFGYKRAIIFAFVLVGIACMAMPLLPGFLTTKLLFLSVGASFALVKISVYSTIGLITDGPDAHASLMNGIEGFFMLGVLSAYWLFSAFIDPVNPGSLSWLNVYWVLSCLCFMAAILTLTTPFPPMIRDTPAKAASLATEIADMLALLWRPIVLMFLISGFLYLFIEQGLATWLPTFNNEILNIPEAMSIQMTSIYAGALAIGRFGAGAVIKHTGWYWLLNICIVLTGGLVLVALPLASHANIEANITWMNAPLAAYILPLTGLFLAPIYPAIASVILSGLPKHRQAAMTGLIVICLALGGTAGSFLTGLLFEKIGGETAFYLTLIPLTGLIISLYWLKQFSGKANMGA